MTINLPVWDWSGRMVRKDYAIWMIISTILRVPVVALALLLPESDGYILVGLAGGAFLAVETCFTVQRARDAGMDPRVALILTAVGLLQLLSPDSVTAAFALLYLGIMVAIGVQPSKSR